MKVLSHVFTPSRMVDRPKLTTKSTRLLVNYIFAKCVTTTKKWYV